MSNLTISVNGNPLLGYVQPPVYPEQLRLAVPFGMDEYLVTITKRTPESHTSPGVPSECPSLSEVAVLVATLAARVIGR